LLNAQNFKWSHKLIFFQSPKITNFPVSNNFVALYEKTDQVFAS
jgi:hypothetical protein